MSFFRGNMILQAGKGHFSQGGATCLIDPIASFSFRLATTLKILFYLSHLWALILSFNALLPWGNYNAQQMTKIWLVFQSPKILDSIFLLQLHLALYHVLMLVCDAKVFSWWKMTLLLNDTQQVWVWGHQMCRCLRRASWSWFFSSRGPALFFSCIDLE